MSVIEILACNNFGANPNLEKHVKIKMDSINNQGELECYEGETQCMQKMQVG